MSKIPENLKYTKDHEWLKLEEDGVAIIGITDYAQSSLGDITFIELPEVGDSFEAGDGFGVVESVKAASDLYMPVAGAVLEINETLTDEPELANQDPYGKAWMIKIKLAQPEEVDDLLDAAAYTEISD